MAEETTTSTVDDTQAAEEPQLEDTNTQDEAVTETDDTSQTSDVPEADPQAEKSDEDDIKEWAAKKNLPLDDPIKLAKMYRDSEKELGRKGQQAGQLSKATETASTAIGADEIQQLSNKIAVMDFYLANPDARMHDTKMAEILDAKPWLANDLDTLYTVAKAQTAEAEILAARQAGKKDALTTAAQAERAGAPKAAATTRETPKEITDEEIGQMSPAEYADWRQAHNPFAP